MASEAPNTRSKTTASELLWNPSSLSKALLILKEREREREEAERERAWSFWGMRAERQAAPAKRITTQLTRLVLASSHKLRQRAGASASGNEHTQTINPQVYEQVSAFPSSHSPGYRGICVEGDLPGGFTFFYLPTDGTCYINSMQSTRLPWSDSTIRPRKSPIHCTAINMVTRVHRILKNVSVKWEVNLRFHVLPKQPPPTHTHTHRPLSSPPAFTPPAAIVKPSDSGFQKSTPVLGLCRGDGSMHFEHQIASSQG